MRNIPLNKLIKLKLNVQNDVYHLFINEYYDLVFVLFIINIYDMIKIQQRSYV